MIQIEHISIAARRQLLIYLALPLTYVITGRLGLLLAVPPGYATAVFVPAGIAVGAMFMAGASTLPGTFLGSLLLNVWIGYSSTGQLGFVSLAAAVVIALASMLQAVIGGAALRRAIGYPAALDNPRDLLFLLVLSPVFCLTSASLSLSGVWALGAMQAADLPINWMTWWVGDTLGVLVTVPLLLVLAGEPRTLWRSRAGSVAVPMLLCLGLFVGIFIRVNSWENDQSLFEFRLRSQQLADTVRATLEEQRSFLDQLSSVFASRHQPVTRQDFHDLVQKLLWRFQIIQAVEWAPRVTSADRPIFEARQQGEVPGFEIRERAQSGALRPAGDRSYFYPVTYVEPLAGNEPAVGFDLASDANRRLTIEAAIAGGDVVATPPIRLVQERYGVLLTEVVSGGSTGAGIVLVVLDMSTFASTLLNPIQSALYLRFADAAGGQPFFDEIPASTSTSFETGFDFGGRHYLVQTAPSAAYLARHRGWQSWAVLAAGCLGTGLIGGLLLLGTGHEHRFEGLANKLRASEASLREKEAELESIIYRTPFMLIRLSRDLRYRFISHAYAELTGRRPEDVIGRPLVEIVGEETFQVLLPHIEKVLRGNRVEFEREVHFRSVGTRYLHIMYTPEKDEHGAVTGWIASMFDITERKHAEGALQKSEQRFRQVVESAPNALLMIDPTGLIALVNAQTEKAFGYTRNELLGKPVEILVPERYRRDHPGLRKSFFADPRSRPMGAGRDLYGLRKEGSEREALAINI
jgi:PAS domain S-box-containing protein